MQIFNPNDDYFIPCFKIVEQGIKQIKTSPILVIDNYHCYKYNTYKDYIGRFVIEESNKFEYLFIDSVKNDKKILSFTQIQNNLGYIKYIICHECSIKDITLFKNFKSLEKISFIDCKFKNGEYYDNNYMNLSYWYEYSQYQEVSNALNDNIEIIIDNKNKEQLLTNYSFKNIENINDILIDIQYNISKNNILKPIINISIESSKNINEEIIEEIVEQKWFDTIILTINCKYAPPRKKIKKIIINSNGKIKYRYLPEKSYIKSIEYIDDDIYLIKYYNYYSLDELDGDDKILIIPNSKTDFSTNITELLENNFLIINPKNPYICRIRDRYKSEIICNSYDKPLFYLINGVYFPYDLIERIFYECELNALSSESLFELKLHILLTYEKICVKNLTKLLLFENRTFEENSKSIHDYLLQYFGFKLIKEIIRKIVEEKYTYLYENIEDSIKETLLYVFKEFIETVNEAFNENMDDKYIYLFYGPLLKDILENKIFENIKDDYIKYLYVDTCIIEHIEYTIAIKEIKEICYKYLSLESPENIILKNLFCIDIKISNLEKYITKSTRFNNHLNYDVDYIGSYLNKEYKYNTIELMLLFGFDFKINPTTILNYSIDILNNNEHTTKKIQNLISLFYYMYSSNVFYIKNIFYDTSLTTKGRLTFIICLNNILHNKSNLNLLKPNLEFDHIIKKEYEDVKALSHNEFYHESSYYEDYSYYYESEEYYYQLGCGYVNVEKYEENLLLEKIYNFETNILNININFNIRDLIHDWLKKEPSLDSIRILIENQILLLPPELKDFKQYFNKNELFTRDQINIIKLRNSVNHFQQLLNRIDNQMNFDFTSILYFNDNITDCSQSIIEEIDYIDRIMSEDIAQIIRYQNYLTNIKTNITYYSTKQKLTDEENKKIINIILKYNYY